MRKTKGLGWLTIITIIGLLFGGGLTAGASSVSAATAISGIKFNTPAPALYDKFEVQFNLDRTYTNPFDPDEVDVRAVFTTPSGHAEVVPAFYGSASSPNWAVRYSPRERGLHSFYLTVTDKAGTSRSETYSFKAAPPGRHSDNQEDSQNNSQNNSQNDSQSDSGMNRGFMGVSGSRFVDSYGRQLTLLGTNYGWGGPNEILPAMPEYKAAKMNFMRVWLQVYWNNYAPEYGPLTDTHNGITMKYDGVGRYQLDNMARMDTLMDTAASNGIYVMLTVFNYGDFQYNWKQNAYNRDNGGPSYWSDNNTDFWTNPAAIGYQKKLLRYIFARWGYQRSLGMLEYWNESDNHVDTPAATRDAWHATVDGYWKSWDFYHHPTTTSFAWKDHKYADQMSWDGLNTLDAVNIHQYYAGSDVIDVWEKELKRQRVAFGGRPVFAGEYGIRGDDRSTEPNAPSYYHDGVWAPMFRAGAAGANVVWILDQAVKDGDPSGFNIPLSYKDNFTSLAGFIQPEETYLPTMPFFDYGRQANDTKVGAFRNGTRALLWINDTLAPYDNANPRTVGGMNYVLDGLYDGTYKIAYYDTYSGAYISKTTGIASGGRLTLDVPSFTRDIAVKVIKQGRGNADLAAPSAPFHLRSPSHDGTSVNLEWDASTDNIGVIGYDVYRDGVYAGSASSTAFKDGGLVPGKTYMYTVRSKDAAGNFSPESGSLDQGTELPGGGTNLLRNPGFEADDGSGMAAGWTCGKISNCSLSSSVVHSGTGALMVDGTSGAWFGVEQSVPGMPGTAYTLDGYVNMARNTGSTINVKLQFLNNSGAVVGDRTVTTVSGTATAGYVNLHGNYKSPAGTAQVRVRLAFSNTNATVYFDDFSLTASGGGIVDTQAPSVPANLRSPSHTGTSAQLEWDPSTDNVEVTGYDVYRNGVFVGTTAVPAYTDTGLLPVTMYEYTVKAKDDAGNVSAASGPVSVTTDAAGGTGDGGAGAGLLLNPDFEADDGSGRPAGWLCEQLQYCSRSLEVVRSGASSLKVDGTAGAWFAVEQSVAATPGEPYTFDGYLNITRNSGTKIEVNVQFLNGADNVLSDNALAAFDGTATAGFTNLHGTYIAPAGTVKVKIRLHFTNLNATVYFDDFSLTGGGGTPDGESPTVPQNLRSPSHTDTSVTLDWDASTDNIGVSGYDVYRDGVYAGTASSPTFTDRGLSPLTSYGYSVKAKDGSGNVSAGSREVTVTTDAAGTAGPNLLLNPGFETDDGAGRPADWLCEQTLYCSRDTATARSGAASLKVDGTAGAWFAVEQIVPAAAGTVYTFDGFVDIARNAGTKIEVNVQFLNGTDSVIADQAVAAFNGATTSGFRNLHGVFTAPADSAKVRVRFYFTNLNATVYVDDLSLSGK